MCTRVLILTAGSRAKEKKFAKDVLSRLKHKKTWPSSRNCPSVISPALNLDHLTTDGNEDGAHILLPFLGISNGTE